MAINTQNTQPAQAQGALGVVWGYVEPVVEKVPYGWVVVKAVSVVGAVLGLRRAQQQPAVPAPANPPVVETVLRINGELQTAFREDGIRHSQVVAEKDKTIKQCAQENIALLEEVRTSKCQRNACIAAVVVLLTGAGAATTYVATKMSRY